MADLRINLDVSGVKSGVKALENAFKNVDTASNKIVNSVTTLEKNINMLRESFESFGKPQSSPSKPLKDTEQAAAALNKGVSELNKGLINSTQFALRYGKALSELKSETKSSYGENLKYEKSILSAAEAVKKSNTAIREQEKAIKASATAADKLAKQQATINTATQKLKRGVSELNSGLINSTQFAQRYGAALSTVKKAVRDTTGENRSYVDSLEKTSKALDDVRKKEQQLEKQTSTMGNTFKTVRAAAIGYATVLATMELQQFVSDTVQAGIALDSLNRSYAAITGNSKAAREEISFVANTAETLGLRLDTLENSYKGVIAASKGTSLEGENARKIFLAINKAAAVLGMSADDTEGSLRALTQMISKGNIQAEELRGQLGERLFGAFQKAATAMGVTTQKLNDMLKNGEVIAEDFIPRFANVLENDFAAAAVLAGDRVEASFNRMYNATTEFQRLLSSSGIIATLQLMADETTKFLRSLDPEKVRTTVVVSVTTIADAIAILKRTVEVAFKGIDILLQEMNVLFWELSNTIINGPIMALQSLIDLYNKIPSLPEISLPKGLTDFGEVVTEQTNLAREAARIAVVDLGEILTRPLPSSKIIDLVTQTVASLDKITKKSLKSNQEQSKKLTDAEKMRLKEIQNSLTDISQAESLLLKIKESGLALDAKGLSLMDQLKTLVSKRTSLEDEYKKIKGESSSKELTANDKVIKQLQSILKLSKAEAAQLEKNLKLQASQGRQAADLLENIKKSGITPVGELADQVKQLEGFITKGQAAAEKLAKSTGDSAQKSKNNFNDLTNAIKDNVKEQEKAQKAYEDFLSDIEDETSDVFKGIFDETIDDFSDFTDRMFDIFLSMLADMAAKAIAEPIIVPIVQGIGGYFGVSTPAAPGGSAVSSLSALSNIPGFDSVTGFLGSTVPGTGVAYQGPGIGAAVTQQGGISYGDVLGYGAAGSLGYSLLGGALGLPQSEFSGLTSGAGASLGGYLAAGTSIGGPVGAIAGAVIGGVLGGLLGDEPTPPNIGIGVTGSQQGNLNQGQILGSDVFDFVADIGGVGTQEAKDSISKITLDYFNTVFDNINDTLELDVNQALQSTSLNIDVKARDRSEEAIQEAFDLLVTQSFETLREPLLDQLVSPDLGGVFSEDFFKGIQTQGENLFDTFVRFGSIVQDTDGFVEEFTKRTEGLGLSAEKAFEEINTINTVLGTIEQSVEGFANTSVVGSINALTDNWAALVDTLEDANASTEQLTRAETVRNEALGAYLTGLTSQSISQQLTTGSVDFGTTIRQQSLNLFAAQTAETIYSDYISQINEEVGKIFTESGNDIQTVVDYFNTLDLSALDEVEDEFNKAVESFKDLSKEIDKFNEALDETISSNLLTDYEQSLASLNSWYEEQKKTAEDLGLSLGKVNAAYEVQLRNLERQRQQTIAGSQVTVNEATGATTDVNTLLKAQGIFDTQVSSLFYQILKDGITEEELQGAPGTFGNLVIKVDKSALEDQLQSAESSLSSAYESIVNDAFTQLFGRQAAAEGLKYWTDALRTGEVDFANLVPSLVAGTGGTGTDFDAYIASGIGNTIDQASLVSNLNSAITDVESLSEALNALPDTQQFDGVATAVSLLTSLYQEQESAVKDLADEQDKQNQESADRAAEIAAERYALETELLTLEGDTVKLRQREVEALFESNRELKQQIFALQDRQAIESLLEAPKSYIETLGLTEYENEVKSIRDSGDTLIDNLMKLGATEEEIGIATTYIIQQLDQLEQSFRESEFNEAAEAYREGLIKERDILEGNLSTAKENYLSLLNEELSSQESLVSGLESAVDSIKDFRDEIDFGSLFVGTTEQLQRSLLAERTSLLSSVTSGDTDSISDLISVSEDYLGVAQSSAKTELEYAIEVAKTNILMSNLEGELSNQLTEAEQQVSLMKTLIAEVEGTDEQLKDINTARTAYEDAKTDFDSTWYTAEIEKLDKLLDSSLSLEQLMANFNTASKEKLTSDPLFSGFTPGPTTTTGSISSPLPDVFELSKAVTDKAKLQPDGTYTLGTTTGIAWNELLPEATQNFDQYKSVLGFRTGGSFKASGPAGTDNLYYPQMRVSQGEMVSISKEDSLENVASEMTELVNEVKELRSEQEAQAIALVKVLVNIDNNTEYLEQWDVTGLPEERTT